MGVFKVIDRILRYFGYCFFIEININDNQIKNIKIGKID